MHKCPVLGKTMANACTVTSCMWYTEKTVTNCFSDVDVNDETLVYHKGFKSRRQMDLKRGEAKSEVERMLLVDRYYTWLITNYSVPLTGKLILPYPMDFAGHAWSRQLYDLARSRNVFRIFRKRLSLVGVTLENLLLLKPRQITTGIQT